MAKEVLKRTVEEGRIERSGRYIRNGSVIGLATIAVLGFLSSLTTAGLIGVGGGELVRLYGKYDRLNPDMKRLFKKKAVSVGHGH